MGNDFIEIRNPSDGVPSRIPAERVPLGVEGDYKPNIACMPDGELLLTAFHTNSDKVDFGFREDILLFRSHDGGRSWSLPDNLGQRVNLLGREPYLTILRDGTILLTCHFLPGEERNRHGYTANFVHRSADGGKCWSTVEVRSECNPAHTEYGTMRNILERADGTLLHIVTSGTGASFRWTSADAGLTWREEGATRILGLRAGYPYGIFQESHLISLASGRLLMISRVDHRYYPISGREITADEYVVINQLLAGNRYPPISSIVNCEFDQFEHLKLFHSDDEGATWHPGLDIGDYAMMYPSVLRLDKGRIMFTFTVRQVSPPLGVRAVLGTEQEDRLAFDFEHNVLVLDDKTPLDRHSGGGFGNTVHVSDGTLVTSYSYRGDDGETHLEVVRWRLDNACETLS